MRWTFLITVFLTFLLDRITKFLAVKEFYHPVSVIPGLFSLRLAENRGAAFSLFSSGNEVVRKLFLLFIPAAVVLFIFYYAFSRKDLNYKLSISLGLIAGGALGNLYDRIFYGRVVDFIDFHFRNYHYPTFNVADMGVFIGTLLLLVSYRKS